MRFFLLALISLLPLCSKAQFNHGFESGYYVLADAPAVRHTGTMRIEPFYSTLIVKGEGGAKTLKLKPEQLLACGNEKGKYITIKNFMSGRVHIDADFAQQLDSGQVVVIFHSRGSGAGGGISTLMVRRATEETVTNLDAFLSHYREQVMPFITSRPDLVKLIEDKQVGYNDLVPLLHALNTGQPFPKKR